MLHQDLAELLLRLNRILVGWANYFRYLRARGAFDCDNF